MDKRIALQRGTVLPFDGMSCTIGEEIGRGSNAIVYRGWYADSLTEGGRHHVLIKELFPLHPRGLINRNEVGAVCVEAEAQELYKIHLASFERGNRAHLSLLETRPDTIGGNINTFSFNNTHYTVLDYTGGRSIEQDILLHSSAPLKTTARRMIHLLNALDAFHAASLVHLDISADNALLIGQGEFERVMLIDYNSVHSLSELQSGTMHFQSIKSGYTAPEVRTGSAGIGIGSDLFSAAAVFFFMITGRTMTAYEMVRKEPPDVSACECMKDMPEPVRRMTQTILKRGLHPLPARRYQSTVQMQDDLRELIDRIDGVGITHWALWEAGRLQAAHNIRINPALEYLQKERSLYPARIRLNDESIISLEEAVSGLLSSEQKCALLTGQGGIGKTTALLSTVLSQNRRYSPVQTTAVYISLYGWQEGNSHYISDRILEYMRFRSDSQRLEDARHALHLLLDTPLKTRTGTQPTVLLLLDGLNETPVENEGLIQEIKMLSALRGVSILISSRNEHPLLDFQVMQLAALMPSDVQQVFSEHALILPESPEMLNLLRTPLMLSLFVTTAQQSQKQPMPQNEHDLLSAYFAALLEKEELSRSENDSSAHQAAAALYLVLPAVAAECERRHCALSAEELMDTVTRCYKIIKSTSALKTVFPQWIGHSREILGECANAEQWLGMMLHSLLCRRLGLVIQEIQQQTIRYRISHQEIAGYLCSLHAASQARMRRRSWHIRLTSAAAVLALAGALTLGYMQFVAPVPYNLKQATDTYDYLQLRYLDGETVVRTMLNALKTSSNTASALRTMQKYASSTEGNYTSTLLRLIESDETQDGVLEEIDSILADPSKKVIPWSGKTLHLKSSFMLASFAQERAQTYSEYLDLLHYAATDPKAKFGGYYDIAHSYILSIVEYDAQILTAACQLVCDPHLNAEWTEYRANPIEENYYDLYARYFVSNADTVQLETIISNCMADQEKIRQNLDVTGVVDGYQDWLAKQ